MYNFFNAGCELRCKVKLILAVWKHLMNCQFCCQNQAILMGNLAGGCTFVALQTAIFNFVPFSRTPNTILPNLIEKLREC